MCVSKFHLSRKKNWGWVHFNPILRRRLLARIRRVTIQNVLYTGPAQMRMPIWLKACCEGIQGLFLPLRLPLYFSLHSNSHSLGRIFVSPQASSEFESKMALAWSKSARSSKYACIAGYGQHFSYKSKEMGLLHCRCFCW